MYNNKTIKLIIIMLIIFITVLNFNIKVFADGKTGDTESSTTWDPVENPELYKPGKAPADEELKSRAELILGAINVIGVVVSVITLMILGIKYMIGSVEEKAEYKKSMTTYLIGAIFVFSVTTIPNILYRFAISLNNL